MAHSWATLSPVSGFALTRAVWLEVHRLKVPCPSFLPATRYTRPRLPSGGSLGPHFPTFNGTMLGVACPERSRRDYHLSFSMPYALARSSIPCLFPRFVSFLQARQCSGTFASTPGLLCHPVRLFRDVYKETNGSPKFPGYPCKYMPCSQTPVVSSILALAHPGLLLSTQITASAFPPKETGGYPLRKKIFAG